jgi:hypothetical protein
MRMQSVNLEDAAHAIFFCPEYEEAILKDLLENAFVIEEVKEKIREYSVDLIANQDTEEEFLDLEKLIIQLNNLLNLLKLNKLIYGKS